MATMNAPHPHDHLLLNRCPNCGAPAQEEDAGFCHFCSAELLVEVDTPLPPPPLPPPTGQPYPFPPPRPPMPYSYGSAAPAPQLTTRDKFRIGLVIAAVVVGLTVSGAVQNLQKSSKATTTTVSPSVTSPVFTAPSTALVKKATTTTTEEPTTTTGAPTTTTEAPTTTSTAPAKRNLPTARFSGGVNGEATSSRLILQGVSGGSCTNDLSSLSQFLYSTNIDGSTVVVDLHTKGLRPGAGTYTLGPNVSLTVSVAGGRSAIYQPGAGSAVILAVTEAGTVTLDFTDLQDTFTEQTLTGHVTNGC